MKRPLFTGDSGRAQKAIYDSHSSRGLVSRWVGGKEGACKTAGNLGLKSKAALGEGWAVLLMLLIAN